MLTVTIVKTFGEVRVIPFLFNSIDEANGYLKKIYKDKFPFDDWCVIYTGLFLYTEGDD